MARQSTLRSSEKVVEALVEVSSSPATLGSLVVLDQDGKPTKINRKISARHGLVIGRDVNRCHWVFQDPYMSLQHLRIYVVTPSDSRPDIEPLVCAEDISRNGVYWNGALIGNKSDAFLLSDGDRLRLTSKTTVRFVSNGTNDKQYFSIAQETEMQEFWNKYVTTDKLLDATFYSRKFLAIEQKARTQVACEVVTLERPARNIRPSSLGKRPRKADSLGFQHEVHAVKSWINDTQAKITSEEKVERCFRISQILHSIKHPNLLGLEKIFITDNTIYVFQDLIPAGNLISYVNSKNGKLLEVEAAIAIRQVLHAVQALHDEQFFHRNIRPASILVSSLSQRPRFVLSGFEMARKIIDHRQTRRISGFLMTEVAKVSRYLTNAKECAEAEDLRCVGATAAYLLTGSDQLYNTPSSTKAIIGPKQHSNELEILPNQESLRQEAMKFINHLTRTPSHLKPSAKHALDHIWFSPAVQNVDVKRLCGQAVHKWRPALLKDRFITFVRQKSRRVQEYDCSQQIIEENRPSRGRSPRRPVEPPYKPFYRGVYDMSHPGDRGGLMPKDKASTRLRELSANWLRSISSLPSRARIASLSDRATVKHNPDEAENSFQIFRGPEIQRHDQPIITALSDPPKLARRLSFRQQRPNPQRGEPFEEASLSEKRSKNNTSINAAPSSLVEYRLSRERKIVAVEDVDTLNATQEDSEMTSVQYITGSQRRLEPPVQSSAESWALNVRSESKLNARTRSRSGSLLPTPRPGKRRTVFEIADENNNAPVTPVTTTRTRNDVLQDDSKANGVTPHLAHLRLAQHFE